MRGREIRAWVGVVCLIWVCGVPGWAQNVPPAATAVQTNAHAVVPHLIKFSGTLQNLAGKPLTGPVDVTFSLYAEEAGGNALWFETQTVQADSLGRYNVLLGAMTPAGVPLELFAAGEARWLGTFVTGLPEPPRVLLVSVPYALKAGDAETLGGKPASAFMLASQASTETTKAAAAGTLSGLVQADALTGGGGTLPQAVMSANYIPVFTDALGNHGNSVMYQSGSFVGFNTTSPSFGIDLNSNVFAIGPKAALPGGGGTMRFRDDSGTVRWSFGVPGTVGATDFFLYNNANGHAPFYIQADAASYSLYMHANGNVGIGTTSPTQKLDVVGNVRIGGGGNGIVFPDGTKQTTASTGGATDLNCASCVSSAEVDFSFAGSSSKGGDATNALALGGVAPGGYVLKAGDLMTGALGLPADGLVAGGNQLVLAGGSVGIGTALPVSKLDVAGDINMATGLKLGGSTLLTTPAGTFNTAVGLLAESSSTGTANNNTAVGYNALHLNATGDWNTAIGKDALANSTASANTAVGNLAMIANTTGTYNTAVGGNVLPTNTTGSNNTAVGHWAVYYNDDGSNNTGIGEEALKTNVSGTHNVALGYQAAYYSTTNYNTAVGSTALYNTGTGTENTAVGYETLYHNVTGSYNTAVGGSALHTATGGSNVAVGWHALVNNGSGNHNIAIGITAARDVGSANSDNIHIGNVGSAADDGVIKIGTPGTQTKFFTAGVYGVTTGSASTSWVLVDVNGQLGTVASSRRYKEDIQDMGEASHELMRLRPVTFRYKQPFADGTKPIQYGLIAEEVAEVNPELVARSADGKIETVKYHVLPAMLLNEVQRQQREIDAQKEQIRSLRQEIEELKAALRMRF